MMFDNQNLDVVQRQSCDKISASNRSDISHNGSNCKVCNTSLFEGILSADEAEALDQLREYGPQVIVHPYTCDVCGIYSLGAGTTFRYIRARSERTLDSTCMVCDLR